MIRILAADDHALFRQGLFLLLKSQRDFAVVGDAADGRTAVNLAAKLKPDVLLLDPVMPGMTGLETLWELSKRNLPVKTIAISDNLSRNDMLQWLESGARGFISKEAQPRILFEGIRCVVKGEYWVGREGVANFIDFLRGRECRSEPAAQPFGMTARELEVLFAVAEGYSNKDIADRFLITCDTVKHHLTTVFRKTGVSSRLELALFALDRGLLPKKARPNQMPDNQNDASSRAVAGRLPRQHMVVSDPDPHLKRRP